MYNRFHLNYLYDTSQTLYEGGPGKMITLADVAAKAGVSKATASRALNQPQLLAPETRDRVIAAASALGFSVNRAARALAKGSTGIVSIVVPTLENTFFTPIIKGAQRAAEEGDLHATITVLAGDTEADQSRLMWLAEQVDGFVLASPRAPGAFLKQLAQRKPLVTIDRQVEGIPSVIADTPRSLGELVSGLMAAGHRRLTYVGGPEGSWMDQRRLKAIQTAAGEGCAVSVIGPLPPAFASGASIAREIADSETKAVVAYASEIALGLYFELQRLDPSSRGAITMASADDLAVGPLAGLDITALQVDGDAVGESAMATLVKMLRNGQDTSPLRRRVPVPIRWASNGAINVPASAAPP
ncbi:LacI family DNA-binding transcriptional regulator [Arthrobacter sp. UYEF3]|uniref:LacI family DNA-binding transcriptional regulator n=1 Tax=Arthrobacter sp. UYEF3 TaxID=1756365 RepID=UPI0033940651